MIEAALVAVCLCALAAAAAFWCFRTGCILYYGDAQSHLNHSRNIIDSRTPGYDQLGTVWLPVLHVICLPFAGNNWLWQTGLAGTIPVATCFAIAGIFFYFAARQAYGSRIAAAVVVACLVLNPNILYLSAIPMTEIVFLAGLAVLLFALLSFRATQKSSFLALGIAASWWMSLTRYDGWFLIPFAGIWFAFSAVQRRWTVLILVGALASLAPLYWIAHCWWETSNPLNFYNGPYSAKAIQGSQPYPGYHDWKLAALYYFSAAKLCTGVPLFLLGAAGTVCAIIRKVALPVLFLMLTPVFYIWSIHSSGNPLFVPQLWPHGYYNSRYGIAVVVLSAFAAGAIALIVSKDRRALAFVLPVLAVAPWIIHPSNENWICWKESFVNSVSRRAWTAAGAEFVSRHYQTNQDILIPSGTGDVAGILCRAGIPLRESLNVDNGPEWMANTARPDLIHEADWAVAQAGDPLAKALGRSRSVYRVIHEIEVPGAPALEIYRRMDAETEK